jgi:hypothetical protein
LSIALVLVFGGGELCSELVHRRARLLSEAPHLLSSSSPTNFLLVGLAGALLLSFLQDFVLA